MPLLLPPQEATKNSDTYFHETIAENEPLAKNTFKLF